MSDPIDTEREAREALALCPHRFASTARKSGQGGSVCCRCGATSGWLSPNEPAPETWGSDCPLALREALDAATAERDRLRDALRDQRTTIATTIRARATQRRATAEEMTAEGEHADAARYYTYAVAEECCAVLVERGTDEPEAADLAAKEAK